MLDHSADYCSIRKDLEYKVQVLLITYSALTTAMCTVVGKHREWTITHARCRLAHQNLLECKERLRSHREKHGC